MVDALRLAFDAVLGILILALLLWMTWMWRRMGPELVITRMSILQTRTYRSVIALTIAVAFILAATGVEIYEQVAPGPWIVDHDAFKTVSLVFLLAGLLAFVPVVRVPRRTMVDNAQR